MVKFTKKGERIEDPIAAPAEIISLAEETVTEPGSYFVSIDDIQPALAGYTLTTTDEPAGLRGIFQHQKQICPNP